ncbi:MAG: hypothetical protein AAB791_02235, partial [Patescibacteria group bacterium]
MKKTILISLIGLVLILAGCAKQAPITDQNINQPVANTDQNVNPLLKITIPSQEGCAYVYDEASYREILKYQKGEVIRRDQLLDNLPAEIKYELVSYLNSQFSITQVCKLGNTAFAYNLVYEDQKGYLGYVIAFFKWDGKQ